MNIKITYNWLLDYLETDADPYEIQKYLSLCGPSIESVTKVGNDYVFDIEITSNRIDTASVFGIAQEAASILPMFGKKAKLKLNPLGQLHFNVEETKTNDPLLDINIIDKKLISRFTAIIFDNVEIKPSPTIIQQRLTAIGVKVINNIVDISNYMMVELGQPIHMFDYDHIGNHKMIMRESKKGEIITTLDKKNIVLPGGDIVIEDGQGRLIDLCGIMGGLLSAINEKTKKIILFVQTYNKTKIRRSNVATGVRTIASTYFEKGLDEERVEATTILATKLIEENSNAKKISSIIDIYPTKYRPLVIKTTFTKINDLIGLKISENTTVSILENLGFKTEISKDSLFVTVPPSRKNDVSIEEDIIEEVARIYGYHNIPSILQSTVYVRQPKDMEDIFVFQNKIKLLLKHLGLNEVINYSMVSKEQLLDFNLDPKKHLRLSNSISEDIEYLRTCLSVSLFKNVKDNQGRKNTLKLFEIAKVYLPKKGELPEEIYKVAITTNTDYLDLKGIVKAIYDELNIDKEISEEIICRDGIYMVEIDFNQLVKNSHSFKKYRPLNSYAVIKLDKTFELGPNSTYAVKNRLAQQSKLLQKIEVVTLYKNKLTLRFYYSSPERNITEEEAKKELEKVL